MNRQEETIPGGMPVSEFLENYWQKKPCLLRQAFPGFKADFDRRSLLSLACEDKVESRLVLEKDGDYPWQVLPGPFEPGDLLELPENHWSLLLQNAEIHIPSAFQLLKHFQFIPNWRVDDLMISYAANAGSVGPHLDSYDVFLLQADGKREWAINPADYNESDFIDGLDLRIIQDFKAEDKYILEAGDMLYLPPGVAHCGIALGESITCSIGFRAPSTHELLTNFIEDSLHEMPDRRYSDPQLARREHPGELTSEELAGIDTLFRSILPDADTLAMWFGRYVSRAPESATGIDSPSELNREDRMVALRTSKKLVIPAAVRSVFVRKEDGVILFANGEAYFLPGEFSRFVYDFTSMQNIDNPLYGIDSPPEKLAEVLAELYSKGLLSTDKNPKT